FGSSTLVAPRVHLLQFGKL
ncbi:hypothetical protein A2U01_0087213, partial [Trifolium medium]|nr:hypothetical protein [Trifolium medium]